MVPILPNWERAHGAGRRWRYTSNVGDMLGWPSLCSVPDLAHHQCYWWYHAKCTNCILSRLVSEVFACWVIFHCFCRLLTFSKLTFYKKIFQGHYQSAKRVGSRSSVLIWIQIVCKGSQISICCRIDVDITLFRFRIRCFMHVKQ